MMLRDIALTVATILAPLFYLAVLLVSAGYLVNLTWLWHVADAAGFQLTFMQSLGIGVGLLATTLPLAQPAQPVLRLMIALLASWLVHLIS
jgi:hypothetical protein